MNVVPELRKSLVKAAARQAAPTQSRGRRPRLAGVVLTAGAVTALAVVGMVLVLSGSPTSPTSSRPPVTGRPAALLAAERLLAQVQLPPGAVAVASDQSHPRQLGSPPEGVLPSGSVDVHRFFLLQGDPELIVNAVQRLNMRLEANGGGGVGEAASSAATASGSGSSRASQPSFSSESNELSRIGRLRRELQVSAASAPGRQVAVRIDARAYWIPPRPVDTLIPSDTHTIVVRVSGAPAGSIGHGLKTATTLSAEKDVALVTNFLNALALAPASDHKAPASQSCSATRIRMTFEGADARSTALAVWNTSCGLVDLWVGHAHTRLTVNVPVSGFDPRTFSRVLRLLAGVS